MLPTQQKRIYQQARLQLQSTMVQYLAILVSQPVQRLKNQMIMNLVFFGK